jgi:hypothetical protein
MDALAALGTPEADPGDLGASTNPGAAHETGDQTDQESRSAEHRAAPSVTAMEITIQSNFLPHNDPDSSLGFYRDTLGFEVRNDVGHDGMRWITIGPADQPMSADPGSRARRRDTEIGSPRQRRPPRDRRAAAGAG